MKKLFVLSTLIPVAMICSCQKQDALAEAQLAQRKMELDVREEALVQREKAVDQREKAVAEKEKAVADNRVIQSRQAPDTAQAEAERQRRIQQLPPEIRALVPNRSRVNAERAEQNPATDRQPAIRTQRSLEDAQRKKGIDGAFASPAAEAPQPDASSPVPSPTPE